MYDSNDKLIKRYSNGVFYPSLANSTVTVPGNGFKLVLITDLIGNEGGFSVERIVANTNSKVVSAHHNYDYAITRQPNCTTVGLRDAVCRTCLNKILDEEIPALGHSIKAEYTVKPDCTHIGKSTNTCTRAGCGYVSVDDVAALGHSYKRTTELVATCTVEGKDKLTCTRTGCTDIKYEAVAALGHNYTRSYNVAATCTRGGGVERTCGRCSYVSFEQTSDSTPHYDRNSDGHCDSCNLKLSDICSCNCHQTSGFKKFIYKFVSIFWKLFKTNQYCACGNKHY